MTENKKSTDSGDEFKEPGEKPRKIALALKGHFSERAKIWWKSDERDEVYCDSDETAIRRGEDYLVAPTWIKCEKCMNKSLLRADWDEAIANINHYFGSNLPEHIVEMTKE